MSRRSLIDTVEVWRVGARGHKLSRVARHSAHLSPPDNVPDVAARIVGLRRPVILQRNDGNTMQQRLVTIGLPLIARSRVETVVVLHCIVAAQQAAAFEVWAPNALGKLALDNGFYGDLDDFARVSEQMTFTVLEGLPGQTCDAQRPVLFDTLASRDFIRANAATRVGLHVGVGIPILERGVATCALLLLTSMASPLAPIVSLWSLDSDQQPRLDKGMYHDPHSARTAASFAETVEATFASGKAHLVPLEPTDALPFRALLVLPFTSSDTPSVLLLCLD